MLPLLKVMDLTEPDEDPATLKVSINAKDVVSITWMKFPVAA